MILRTPSERILVRVDVGCGHSKDATTHGAGLTNEWRIKKSKLHKKLKIKKTRRFISNKFGQHVLLV